MERSQIASAAENFTAVSDFNRISPQEAINADCIGLRIYEAPLIACAAADDQLFIRLQEPGVIGEHFMPPNAWLPEARSVITFFFPYSKAIKQSNARDFVWPAAEWLHGRIEGQRFLNEWTAGLKKQLEAEGYASAVPATDPRFHLVATKEKPSEVREYTEYSSNWSERHVAFISGLGTFGLSRGLITSQGMCGRFCSIITALELTPTPRPYTAVYEYCNMCGACIKNCPASAISLEKGKDHVPCSSFLNTVKEKQRPYYGCGKCQVQVPCESRIPKKPETPKEVLVQYKIGV